MKVGIVGAGRAGSFFARGISARKGQVVLGGIFARRRSDSSRLVRECRGGEVFSSLEKLVAGADTILICVPDAGLPAMAEKLSLLSRLRGKVFLHCSGLHDMNPLALLRARGSHTGRVHPLAALPPRNTREREMTAVWYSLQGNPKAITVARRLVKHLQGRAFTLPTSTNRAYHLAATMIANHTTVLAAGAFKLMSGGSNRAETASMRRAFGGLIRSVARRVEEGGPSQALTGPAARGDLQTIQSHLEILQADDEFTKIYALLSLQAVRMARGRGDLDIGSTRKLETALKRASRSRR